MAVTIVGVLRPQTTADTGKAAVIPQGWPERAWQMLKRDSTTVPQPAPGTPHWFWLYAHYYDGDDFKSTE